MLIGVKVFKLITMVIKYKARHSKRLLFNLACMEVYNYTTNAQALIEKVIKGTFLHVFCKSCHPKIKL